MGEFRGGREVSEYECYLRAIEGLKIARDALRGLAILRSDMRWLLPVRILEELIDRVDRLKDRGGAPLLWLPERKRG